MQLQGLELLYAQYLRTAQLAQQIHGIGQQEYRAQPRLVIEYEQAERDLDDENRQEPCLIPPQFLRIALDVMRGAPEPPMAPQHRAAHDGIGNGGEHHRATQGGADADVLLGGIAAEDYGHEGHGALRQRRAESRQEGTRGRFPDAQFAAQPFDSIDEKFAREINRGGGADEQQSCEHEVQKYTIGSTGQPTQWQPRGNT